jgi:hypothetical protein
VPGVHAVQSSGQHPCWPFTHSPDFARPDRKDCETLRHRTTSNLASGNWSHNAWMPFLVILWLRANLTCSQTVVSICRCIGYFVFVCSNALGYSFY